MPLPSYERLFGDLDLRGGDEAYTVYSPAAYLVDLLRMLEGSTAGAALLARRPDIAQLLLDGENTRTELPYLDIVNEILETVAGTAPYERLRTAVFPAEAPFAVDDARLRAYLTALKTAPVELYRRFASAADPDVLARERLGLSAEMAAFVTTARPGASDVRAAFGLADDRPLSDLADPERFCRATGVTGVEAALLLSDGDEAFDGTAAERLDHAGRLARLARHARVPAADVDLVVRSCCGGRLDRAALRTLAVVVDLAARLSLPVDVVCSLAAPMDPALFTRVFGAIGGCDGDILAPANREFRLRAAAALAMTGQDLDTLVTGLREQGPFDHGGIGPAALAVLHRASRLITALGITAGELFGLFRALDRDPDATLPILIGTAPAVVDCRRILAADDPGYALWMVQTMDSAVRWLRETGLTVADLDATDGTDGRVALAETLRARIAETACTPETLRSRRFGERAARVVHDVLGLTVLIAPDVDAYPALTALGTVTAADLRGLGLGDRAGEKAWANLVWGGVLTADGVIVAGRSGPPVLGRDFDGLRKDVFALVERLRLPNGTTLLYPDDLREVAGPDADELYDNLLYQEYLDADGTVTDPEFFADPRNGADLRVNAGLDDLAEPVAALLAARVAAFRETALTPGPDTFAGLPLGPDAIGTLLASLRFNGHLDDEGRYRDKEVLLTSGDFPIGLDFHAYRDEILGAIRDEIAAQWTALCTITADDLAPVADGVLAGRALDGGDGFSAAERALIEARLAEVRRDQRPYTVDPDALTGLGLTGDERDRIVRGLIRHGYLDEGLAVRRDRIGYLTIPANAAHFRVPGVGDYGREVFALLAGVARELQAGMAEIGAAVAGAADRQAAAIAEVLRDGLGVPADTAEAICTAVAGDLPSAVASLLAADPRGYRRIAGFARLAARLALTPSEVAAVFHDQDLAARFPEPLVLPAGTATIDAVLESADGTILLFSGGTVVRYAADTRAPLGPPVALPVLSPHLAVLAQVDAALARPDGTEWIIGRDAAGSALAFVRQPGGTRWAPTPQAWGTVRNAFAAPDRIDAAYLDEDGRAHLFADGQHVRGGAGDPVDEGFPRPAADWQPGDAPLPAGFAPDAVLRDADGRIHLFAGGEVLIAGTDDARPIAEVWASAPDLREVDAAWTDGIRVYLADGDRVLAHEDGIEGDGVLVADGYPRSLAAQFPGLPPEFEGGLDAVLTGADGETHLFRNGVTVALGRDTTPVPVAQRWGVLRPSLAGGRVDAGFTGLDGRTYLFSGDGYLRYSGADYALADLGFPRLIAGDWGGLRRVGASFVLDGRTYLFGTAGELFRVPSDRSLDLEGGRLPQALRRRFADLGVTFGAAARPEPDGPGRWRLTDERGTGYAVSTAASEEAQELVVEGIDETPFHVRYSTRDYTVPDAGYPRPLTDDWWNLPEALGGGLAAVDAVLTGRDGLTYLFSGDRFVVFDARRRWWSEPRTLREHWDSLPFTSVDAAFLGRDGRTYLFSGDRYVRYSTADYTRVDDRYPARVTSLWGRVPNRLARTGRVDAALALDTHTYLFSGGEYVRYAAGDLSTVEPGYPKPLSALPSEPRLAGLPGTLSTVDAAVADRGTVHVFSGGQRYAASESLYRVYEAGPAARCGYPEDGAILIESPEGWLRTGPVEAVHPWSAPVRPRLLRDVPEAFRTGVDAVLPDLDGGYIFRDTVCFDIGLGRAYPIAERWGIPDDPISRDGVVDAGLVGPDGTVHLFSGEIVLAGGEVRTIADAWGGLTSVSLAWTDGDVCHLVSGDGTRHLAVADGEVIDEGGFGPGFFAAPAPFAQPTAVIVTGATTLLLAGESYVQRTGPAGPWSTPRPLSLLWQGFRDQWDSGNMLTAAFTGGDGAAHLFFGDRYVRYDGRALTRITDVRTAWGRRPFDRVDAAFTDHAGRTFLFSGPDYVRYTGGADLADPGYPRPIAGGLRTEEVFAHLPETFEDVLAAHGLDAVVPAGRHVCVLTGGNWHVVSRTATAAAGIGTLGRVRPLDRVDAAFTDGPHTYLVTGDRYRRYTGDRPDDGYPRALTESFAADLGVPEPPAPFTDGLDGAFRTPDGDLHLFHGPSWLRAGDMPRPIAEVWGRVHNDFGPAGTPVDAAFTAPDGTLYAFRGGQFTRYSGDDLTYADQGFPRTIRDDWGDLPAAFEDGLDGAFTLGGALYLLRGTDYARQSTDRILARPIARGFADLADYRLADLHVISRFARLAHAAGDGTLGALFDPAVITEDPYRRLADLLGRDADEIRWIVRHGGFRPSAPRERLALETVLAIPEIFALSPTPSRLHAAVWPHAWGPHPDLAAAVDRLHALLADRLPAADLTVLDARVHAETAEARRDALAALLLAGDPEPAPGALYERLLVDVRTGAAGRTSRIREAVAAVQLFVHRYLLDLEPGDEGTRARIRGWWAWMRNYRTWEANRKVFVHPENYLRPELRDTKTPAFRQLESDLLQSGITAETARAAFTRYLDEYTEVSRLAIAGGYVHLTGDGGRSLVLFGRTRTSPRRFYHRTAVFQPGDRLAVTWGPWLAVGVQIDAEKVYPVHAFGRIFAFWTTMEAVPPPSPGSTTITTRQDGDAQEVSAEPARQCVKIWFSFLNLNGEWVPAQSLGTGQPRPQRFDDVFLTVRSGTLPGRDEDHQAVLVGYNATVDGAETIGSHFALTPEHYTIKLDDRAGPALPLRDVTDFLEETPAVDPSAVTWFSTPETSTDGLWFSVDHKGGSFLCRPILPPPASLPKPRPLTGNKDGLPASWERIDAGVELTDPDGTRYFFDNNAGEYAAYLPREGRSRPRAPIAGRWGRNTTAITRAAAPDAILRRGGRTYVFAGDQYVRYSGPITARPDPHTPLEIRHSIENLPKWHRVDWAHTGPDGTEYFFSADLKGWTSARENWTVRPMDRGWAAAPLPENVRGDLLALLAGGLLGPLGAAYAASARTAGIRVPDPVAPARPDVDLKARWWTVDTGWVHDGRLFLISGPSYARYTLGPDGSVPDLCDEGFPAYYAGSLDAVFRQGDRRYLLQPPQYGHVPADADLRDTGLFQSIAGRWQGLPATFDGVLDARTHLYFFVGNGYLAYPKDETLPYEFDSQQREVVRLTTSTAFKLNQRLLAGGVAGLLDPAVQETDELPMFSTTVSDSTTVRIKSGRVDPARLPGGAHLDFASANGTYYWEIFFHAPLLIAHALHAAQRFEEARVWYEYLFDPTRDGRYWRFLPFRADDPAALADDITAAVGELRAAGADLTTLEAPITRTLAALSRVTPAFRGLRDLDAGDRAGLAEIAALPITPPKGVTVPAALHALLETLGIAAGLARQHALTGDRASQLDAYRNDPFDPHAIAALRPVAYRRAVVMGYIDNLIDWGDLLFRQYTPESVDEARMLYILAHDLLGTRPDAGSDRTPPEPKRYATLPAPETLSQALRELTAGGAMLTGGGTVHAQLADQYFHVPGNPRLGEYWDLVADRLQKIRQSLDIMGISRPLPLFAPPIDPAALVRAVAGGDGAAAAVAGALPAVPHQRFAVVLRRAQELTDRVKQLGQDLLGALDRQESEELTLLQNRQESEILALTRTVREAQVAVAEEGVRSATAARDAAAARISHYQGLIDDGVSPLQAHQLNLMASASAAHFTASALKIGAAIAKGTPQVLIGPFIVGTEYGGDQIGDALGEIADISESMGEGLSLVGEILGIRVEQETTQQDWRLQLDTARHERAQLEPQISAADHTLTAARRELAVAARQAAHADEVGRFLRGRFTGAELYQWTAGRLGALYFQAYALAEETARSAERAFQFERGLPGVSVITPGAWDSRRNGLLAGEHLALALDRLAKTYDDDHHRGLEITRRVSLRAHDPLALIRLRAGGTCDFTLTEQLYDRDFPGHYRRQIRTVSVSFLASDGTPLRPAAMLTQTAHKTVLTPDPKAVRHLLDPQQPAPDTLRFDWRAGQRIALSETPDGIENNGLFELRYDDERYLPFEGTGAVSSWTLALPHLFGQVADVEITVRYTAEDGGETHAAAVRGMLKPSPAARWLDVPTEFEDAWRRFRDGDDDRLILPLTAAHLPGIADRQITGVAVVPAGGGGRFLVGGNPNLALTDGRLLATPGVALPADGYGFPLAFDGDRTALTGLVLVLAYRAAA